MNRITQHVQETTHSILEHLDHVLPASVSSVQTPTLQSRPETVVPASLAELTLGLQDLLGRYVALLEATDHAGWSEEDDETVLRTLALLERANTREESGASSSANSRVSAALTFAAEEAPRLPEAPSLPPDMAQAPRSSLAADPGSHREGLPPQQAAPAAE